MSPKTAYLKKTSEQRCREAFDAWRGASFQDQGHEKVLWNTWQACWKYLEGRLLKEIQS